MADRSWQERPQRLAEMVQPQPGAVVSRTLINKPAGTVTLFAFDQDQSLSEHTAPFDALAVCLGGQLELTVSGVVSRLAEGEVLLLPANRPHAVFARTRCKMALVMIRD